MGLHAATVKLSEQPTNKKRRSRVKQAFQALVDVYSGRNPGSNGGFTSLQNLQLPQVQEIAQNLSFTDGMLAGGLPASLKLVQQGFQEIASLAPATPDSQSLAADALQQPADLGGEQSNKLPTLLLQNPSPSPCMHACCVQN